MSIGLIPQYKDEIFATQKEFDTWLAEKTHTIIVYADLGQDLQRMWVAETGEILHCDFQSWIYNSSFVNMAELEDFTPVQILRNGEWQRMNGLLVNEINRAEVKKEAQP